MPETLYLIDGYAAIFRAYFAIRRPLVSPVTGEPTQAVLVFAGMLLKLLTRFRPDYIVVALDAPGKTFRDELYEQYRSLQRSSAGDTGLDNRAEPRTDAATDGTVGDGILPDAPPAADDRYKGNRPAMPGSLDQQIPRILEMLTLLGIPTLGKPGLEADDVIATLVDRVLQDPARGDVHVHIVSNDKDLQQLLGERVTLFDVHTEATLDAAALREKKGITPAQVVDVLALAGDAVDNIPGVAGIGTKTAAQLVQRFGSLDGVLAHLDEVPGTRRRHNLEQACPYLPLLRALVTLRRDPDIPFSLEEARVRPLAVAPLLALFEQLGFNRLQQEVRKLAEAPGT